MEFGEVKRYEEDEELKKDEKKLSGKALDDSGRNTGLGSISSICTLVVTCGNVLSVAPWRMEGCNSGISRLGTSATTVAGSRVLE